MLDLTPNEQADYHRIVVALGHLGAGKTDHETRYIKTRMMAADIWANRGKPIAGIKRV